MRRAIAPLLVLACLAAAVPTLADGPESPRSSWFRPPRPPVTQPFRVELLGEDVQTLPTFALGARRYVLGSQGERYRIHIVNPTAARAEVVVSVDGLDVLDGQSASLAKRGYLLPAFGEVTIDGWRTSLDTVAAFRFSSVSDSYAARSERDRNVGVIGVAFFRERPQVVARRAAPSAPTQEDRAGLGTRFGEQRESSVRETAFERADAHPMTALELRYNDRDGLRALGIRVTPDPVARENELELRETAEAFPGSRFALSPR